MLAVYVIDLAEGAAALEAVEAETPRLSSVEKARAVDIPDDRRRATWRASHIALRIVLEAWAGDTIRGQPFEISSSGRPSLPGPAPAFSLSHTEGLALIACASAGPVGVDVERARELMLSPERQAMMIAAANRLTPTDGAGREIVGTLQAWTRLEALGKALGTGVGAVLTAAREDAAADRKEGPDPNNAAIARLLSNTDLCVVDLALPGPYSGALAAPRLAGPPRIVPLPVDEAGLRAFAAERDCVDLPDRPGQKVGLIGA